MLSRSTLLLLNGAILTGCAVFVEGERKLILTSLMLFLPLLDSHYRWFHIRLNLTKLIRWLAVTTLALALLIINPTYLSTQHLTTLLAITLFTVLPEEWFFRYYFQTTLHKLITKRFATSHSSLWASNVLTSTIFTCMHLPIQGIIGFAVFIPSLVLGYLYQLKKDLIFVILVHALFNLFFIIYIQKYVSI